jgi:hypothetical protein
LTMAWHIACQEIGHPLIHPFPADWQWLGTSPDSRLVITCQIASQ